MVDGEGFQRLDLARAEIVFWQDALPLTPYRYDLRVP